ncbi:hypothetical protein Hanom_Chr11g01015041 [Helianthus anomalus]
MFAGKRNGVMLYMFRPSLHNRGPRLRSPNVCSMHPSLMLPQQTRPNNASLTAPICLFFRSSIGRLVIVEVKVNNFDHDLDLYSSCKPPKLRKARNFSEGSSSFKGLSGIPSFGKMVGRGSGRISVDSECIDKP